MSEISAYRDGVRFERERIIKLLDVCPGDDWHERTLFCCECNLEKVSREEVIALIEGETE
jgi:hypothetical protein